MTLLITISCDGTRHRQTCRGALHTRSADLAGAIAEAWATGWTTHSGLAPAVDLAGGMRTSDRPTPQPRPAADLGRHAAG